MAGLGAAQRSSRAPPLRAGIRRLGDTARNHRRRRRRYLGEPSSASPRERRAPGGLVSRHPLRQHQFDSDPGWLGPKFMSSFSQERDYDRRRALITDARHRGSVPPDVQRALCRAIARGQIGWHEGRIERLELRPHGLELELPDEVVLEMQHVLLATGFEVRRPGGTMVDELIESASLPCAGCGYPIPGTTLRWHPHVYVSGPLAELELGPASRNIAGARRAGERIVDGIRQRTGERRPRVRATAGVSTWSQST